jgi:hypothetical protein
MKHFGSCTPGRGTKRDLEDGGFLWLKCHVIERPNAKREVRAPPLNSNQNPFDGLMDPQDQR